jgi:hypothetical protein
MSNPEKCSPDDLLVWEGVESNAYGEHDGATIPMEFEKR